MPERSTRRELGLPSAEVDGRTPPLGLGHGGLSQLEELLE
jgi:hypothetical protein